VTGQALVQERVVRAEQFEDAAILPEHALKEEIRFSSKRKAQVFIETREGCRIRQHILHIPEV